MSHHATSWAIKAGNGRGLTAAAKLVLWQLADRHNSDFGCFPSQLRLAEDCEVSKSQLNVHLASLERAGLIRRMRQLDQKTRRQRPTRYLFAFEAGFEPLPVEDRPQESDQPDLPLDGEPSPETGLGTVSENMAEPSPILQQSRVRPAGHKPVREPVRESIVRSVDAAEVDRAFAEFWGVHPRPSQSDASRKLFLQAVHAGEEAREIVSGARKYAKEQAGNKPMYVCRSDNWLKEKRWRDGARPGGLSEAKSVDAADFWADAIKKGRYIPPSAISPALVRDMLSRGLVDQAELVKVGVRA